MKISIILPTYNEKDNIVNLIKKIDKEFSKGSIKTEIIVVDDSSPDGTAEEVGHLKMKNVKLIVRREKGLPSAIRRGLDEASGDLLAALDTDLSHPPAHLYKMAKAAASESVDCLVNATRWKKGGAMRSSKTGVAFSKIINRIVRFSLKLPYTDYTGGFFVISGSFYRNLSRQEKDFIFNGSNYGEYFIKFLAITDKKGLKIAELPFVYTARTCGQSKTSLVKHGKLYLDVINETKKWLKKY